jgi:hypothetical protein
MIFYKLDVQALFKAFSALNPLCFLIIIPVYCSVFIFRGLRWKILLPEAKSCSMPSLLDYMFLGYFINCIFPARAGDFYRSYLIGKERNINKVKVFASIFIERIFDGSIVLLFLIYAIVSFFREQWVYKLAISVGIFFWGGFIALMLLAKLGHPYQLFEKIENIAEKLPECFKKPIINGLNQINKHMQSFVDGLSVFHSLSDLLIAFGLTVIIWIVEITVIYTVIRGYGINAGYMSALFTLTLAVFGAMIPVTSTFLGPYQYAFIVGLGVFGIAKEQALAISLTTQFAIFALISVGCFISLVKKKMSIFNIKQEISSQDKELISNE